MSIDVESILSGQYLIGLIHELAGVPVNILPPAWTTVSRRINGDSGTYLKVVGTAKLAQLVQYGAKSKALEQEGVSEVPVKLLHTFHHQNFKMDILNKLKSPIQNVFDQGKWEVDRQTAAFKKRFTGFRISSIYSTLTKGLIWFDVNGNVLPSAADAAITVNFGVPPNNQNQCNGIIATKWSDAAAKILSQITNLKKTAMKLTGYPLTTAFYGASIPNWLASNTACAALIKGNNVIQTGFLNGGIPNGFAGLNWIPLNQAYFTDKADVKQDWLADDFVVFTPDPTPDWWEFTEGSYQVPNSINLASDAPGALGNFTETFGQFSYATIETDPPGIKQLAGDTFLPILKVPGAIFIADVEFG